MTVRELRQKFLAFFESKGHSMYPSGSLVPVDVTGRLDESLLFNGAGMVQFKPFFRGIADPPSRRLCNAQKCLRTGDIDEVGDLTHLTFFEMMGNFSFGDYFKKGAIDYSWEFITSPEWLGLDPHRLSVTVYETDDEAYEAWSEHFQSVGIDPSWRVMRLGEDTNYWPAGAFSKGPPGPCGPNTEMFYWVASEPPPLSEGEGAGGGGNSTSGARDPSPPTPSPPEGRGGFRIDLVGQAEGAAPSALYSGARDPSPPTPSPPEGRGGFRSDLAGQAEGAAPSAPYSREDWIRDEGAGKWLEFWNDVFIQFEWQGEPQPNGGFVKTGMPNLPFPSVDTGMGLERSACVLGGYQSVYDTDVFQPIFRLLEHLATHPLPGLSASASLPTPVRPGSSTSSLEGEGGNLRYGQNPVKDVAMRIIADHLRAACFCIADGILPSNTGRGYVLRRLIRRAVLKGQRVLGFEDLFAYRVFDGIIEAMGDHYQELHFRRDVIVETLKNEEALFRRTLEQGTQTLLEIVEARNDDKLSGELAFMLYDTYGFPLEVTQEICREFNVEIEMEGYKIALSEAQERSRGADHRESVYGGVILGFVFETEDDGKPTPTVFRGYDSTETKSLIVGALPVVNEQGMASSEFVIALDVTPFYAESGGQVSDSGELVLIGPDPSPPTPSPSEGRGGFRSDPEGSGGLRMIVKDVTKQDGVFVHLVEPVQPLGYEGQTVEEAQMILNEKLFKEAVHAKVDVDRRTAITRNHTATHLLHAALRKVLGNHVTQAGSLVSPEHLRFDFTHGNGLSTDEVGEVERTVNSELLKAVPVVVYEDVNIDDARKMGAMALFGEKYGDKVRVVQIGGMSSAEPSSSRELCGGIHVKNTGEIGLFKILHEASAASGVRRIEAVTGLGAYNWVLQQESTLEVAASRLKTNPKEIVHAIDKTLENLKEERKKRERLAQQGTGGKQTTEDIGPFHLVVEKLSGADPKDVQARADRIVEQGANRVAVIANTADAKLVFVVKCGAEAVKAGAHAGNLVKTMAAVAGGGGGGRHDFATAGGRDVSKLDEAIKSGRDALAEMA